MKMAQNRSHYNILMGKPTGASLNVTQCRNEKGRFRGFLKHSQKGSFASSESICTKEEAVIYNLEKSTSIDNEYKDDFGCLNNCQLKLLIVPYP